MNSVRSFGSKRPGSSLWLVRRPARPPDRMALDSKVVFAERLRDFGLSGLAETFEDKGWTTLATFAFATAYTPGQQSEDVFKSEVLAVLFGEGRDDKRVPAVRRLFFEAFSACAADMRRRLEAGDEEAPRKLPLLEREDRRQRVARKLAPAIKIEDEHEPSHALVDSAQAMFDENAIRYQEWSKLTKRDQEVEAPRGELREWRTDSQGDSKGKPRQSDLKANISCELRLGWALARRSIANEIGSIMSFEAGELISSFLLRERMSEPRDSRYAPPSMEQIRKADIEIWRLLGKRCRVGIRPKADGSYPLDEAVPGVLVDPAVTRLLTPLPHAGGAAKRRSRSPMGQTDAGRDSARADKRKRHKANKAAKAAQTANQQGRQQQQVVGSSSRGTALPQQRPDGAPNMPAMLRGKLHKIPEGNLCFGYNLGACREAGDTPPGGRCRKGFHICAEPGCGKNHPFAGNH